LSCVFCCPALKIWAFSVIRKFDAEDDAVMEPKGVEWVDT